jgi:hypothetical protein
LGVAFVESSSLEKGSPKIPDNLAP